MSDPTITETPRAEFKARRLIRTFTGKQVDPLDLQPDDVDIRDIAHHLSLINRWGGAAPIEYSVATHSLWVANRLRYEGFDADVELAGLLHDAAEYVLGDMVTQIKYDSRMQWFRDLGDKTTRIIFAAFRLDYTDTVDVKAADDASKDFEEASFWGRGRVPGPESPRHVERAFLARFNELQRERNWLKS